jgi:formamidopyrimidine-DNA glycosylase
MPELPEVETIRRGIAPHVEGKRVSQVIVRQRQLRWPVPVSLEPGLTGSTITRLSRRGKYLLLGCKSGTAIIHLGMSGSLQVLSAGQDAARHDHIDILFGKRRMLRLHDPRRFGCMLWTEQDPLAHALLRDLGPEPLTMDFDASYLHQRCQGSKRSIKTAIMDSHVVVGVGNIYASEALFVAGVHPLLTANKISLIRHKRLTAAIKQVLSAAIAAGGTTLRDFVDSDGKPGYFSQQLKVYGRAGEPCLACGQQIEQCSIGQRSSFFCPHCQKQ